MVKNDFKTPNNAIVYIDNCDPRKVLEYSYNFNMSIDKDNQPCGIIRGGKLTVKLDAITKGEKDNEILDWMLNREPKKVRIFVNRLVGGPDLIMKELVFEGAYCIDYKENWKDLRESKGDSANTEEIQIAWKEFKWGGCTYKNAWS